MGPTYHTCDSCHTRVAVGVATYVDGRGGEAAFRVCERDIPARDQEHIRIELYEPECRLCGGAHSPECR